MENPSVCTTVLDNPSVNTEGQEKGAAAGRFMRSQGSCFFLVLFLTGDMGIWLFGLKEVIPS